MPLFFISGTWLITFILWLGKLRPREVGIVSLGSHSQVINGRTGTRSGPLRALLSKMLVEKQAWLCPGAAALDQGLGRESGNLVQNPLTWACNLGKSSCFSGPWQERREGSGPDGMSGETVLMVVSQSSARVWWASCLAWPCRDNPWGSGPSPFPLHSHICHSFTRVEAPGEEAWAS